MAPRVRFPGDPQPGSTVPPGGREQPQNPLGGNVAATTEERLSKEDEDYNAETGEDEDQVVYEREQIGARIGVPMEETAKLNDYEEQLDTEDVVPLLFPRQVMLQHNGLFHRYGPGVHMVPVSIAGETPKQMHKWLRDNKVRRVGPKQSRPTEEVA